MKDHREILLAPVVSEKSYGLLDENKYTFLKNIKTEILDKIITRKNKINDVLTKYLLLQIESKRRMLSCILLVDSSSTKTLLKFSD